MGKIFHTKKNPRKTFFFSFELKKITFFRFNIKNLQIKKKIMDPDYSPTHGISSEVCCDIFLVREIMDACMGKQLVHERKWFLLECKALKNVVIQHLNFHFVARV